ncbi:MAG: SulP family inorganic anion transporter [Candidatus Andeanibacterium colombiense]|uniref:SulP family inorganic anion transporter n=1 Tax=Candidatus Andeanibacterium colombiense TaxID=3121345 RepID=A0AAJ5X9I8_9SPHN|nr:MAG: SulP family inorganic anion transporter [Sphingomonadaceae bacterium]
MPGWLPASLGSDFIASLVVFLVALPLCMGIAVASGMPPEAGLVTGIIGGIVVGLLAGSPLQVSGPAAGLAVLVFEIVQEQGVLTLGLIVLLAGAIQIAAGALRIGHWFRAISPAVVHGMLAGIGLLIVLSQLHVLLDRSPLPSGLANLAAIPGAFFELSPNNTGSMEAAFALGGVTILAFLAWEKWRPRQLRLVPGALVGVVAATLLAFILGPDVKRVVVPESIVDAFNIPGWADLARLGETQIIVSALIIAFVASAETLLSAAAVDRMHDGPRTKYNKELVAQGVGNMACGFVGGLPMTGVIVRSSANVQAGGVTRLSAILHGCWILGFVVLLPWLLREMPTAALAGVLVVTGWRLVSLTHAKHLFRQYGPLPAAVWAVTFVMVVATDLLTGVLVGLALSLLELAPYFRNHKLHLSREDTDEVAELQVSGAATCVNLPRLAKHLDEVPDDRRRVRIRFKDIVCLDHTCAELIGEWVARKRKRGVTVEYAHDRDFRFGRMLEQPSHG